MAVMVERVGGAGALIDEGARWLRGWSKKTGQTFYTVPSRTPGAKRGPYYTTEYGCTCPGYLHRGRCSHTEDVAEYNHLTRARWGERGWTVSHQRTLDEGCD